MSKKNETIESLMVKLNTLTEKAETLDTTLDEALEHYKDAIAISKKLLAQLDKKQEAFTVLKQEAHDLFN